MTFFDILQSKLRNLKQKNKNIYKLYKYLKKKLAKLTKKLQFSSFLTKNLVILVFFKGNSIKLKDFKRK